MCGNLINLNQLDLNLSKWYCGSDEAFEMMNKNISKCSNLVNLNLNLDKVGYNNYNKTDKSIISIS